MAIENVDVRNEEKGEGDRELLELIRGRGYKSNRNLKTKAVASSSTYQPPQ